MQYCLHLIPTISSEFMAVHSNRVVILRRSGRGKFIEDLLQRGRHVKMQLKG
jgi:hypothetical protein